MITLYVTSVFVFVAYIIIMSLLNRGVPASISDTYYLHKEWHESGKTGSLIIVLFTIFCWLVSIPLLIFWIDYHPDNLNVLPFIACAGLAFVGASPAFKDIALERKVHSASAIVCASASYIWSFIFGDFLISLAAILISIAIFLAIKRTRVFWLEVTAFVNIYIQLLQ